MERFGIAFAMKILLQDTDKDGVSLCDTRKQGHRRLQFEMIRVTQDC